MYTTTITVNGETVLERKLTKEQISLLLNGAQDVVSDEY